MPKKNKKKWIDPKSSSKFELVFRSQADPTYSETGNDRVLAPIGEKKLSGHSRKQHMDLIERLAWTEQPPSAAPQKPQKSRVERLSDDDEDDDWNIVDDLEGAGAKEKEKGKEVEDDARFADADEEEEEKQKAQKSKPKKPSKKANNKDVNLRDFEVGEYGFPMDGYDYSQHFKPMGAAQGAVFMEAPSSNKETAYRKPTFLKDEVFKIGKDTNEDVKKELFGVTPVSDLRDLALDEDGDLDPEILDALNNPDAFESLDDKFVTVLKKGGYGELWGEASDDGGEAEYYSDDFDEEDDGHMERDERGVRLISDLDTRPERGEQAQIFDERFERLMAGYDDDEIGELDPDDPSLQGTHSVDQFGEALDEFINASKGEEYVPVKEDSFKEKFLERAMSMSKQEEAVYIEEEPERDAWDCESIISTYSNLENHPTLIDENRARKIRLSKKTGMPLGVLPSRERPAPDEPKKPAKDLGKPRAKGESKEEKKKRKAMVKETRRMARQQKKSVKEAFKEEEMRQVTLKVQQGPTAGQSVIKY